ncbi:MAG: ornithine carbamoyltransferase [gamma proteobacterium symbiont of Bathyaustriella thionipta]|nr:ornithine carbamoyltransferase [gamma proteobacterium symbiont of Bathyaustriella thionipta]MCU7949839.1 ornithine carbamoyltransferase [gamma proteobacterium symbiont of Bathyaustriella thionipta]MCU7954089.1 ornithine carbamoyltransferase [gamma proteobacterium symbiont of Bathyaustriella thionipta]MCU7956413.1 ornithine carbamoyltransferase [gamma proteobacterium symbiont of Bathyaustriella thionipta]MCU7966704.1 ornithine carbamoyltransferase [gamma proteobacterium symbiont of Bathyaustr
MTTENNLRHFLTLMDFSSDELRNMTDRAVVLKQMQKAGDIYEPLKNRMLGMIFEKSSTRTRVSFETGMVQFGGGALFLSPRDTQLGRGEPIEDSARVLSQMVDIIMIRTFEHEKLETFAHYSSVPVINALTDMYHPCQLLADMQCYQEHRGSIEGKTVTWVGDGNNMCHSYINAARQWGFKLNIACPEGYDPDQRIFAAAGDQVEIIRDPMDAATDSDLVVTDVWTSMGQEEEQARREVAFDGYYVDDKLMAQADNDAIFMHCLPAHRGEEVSASVIDGKQSVVWDEAGNRLHAQKALLEFLMKMTP